MPLEQYSFGAGTLFLVRTDIATPTPTRIGTLQDVSIDMSFDAKELTGQYQAPVAVARGKMKITGKSKFAKINARSPVPRPPTKSSPSMALPCRLPILALI